MVPTLPGTVLPAGPHSAEDPFASLTPTLRLTGGLTLAQVCSLTGLPATTIQNWVKRGWVPHPNGRRYQEPQVARILIINLLRGSLQLPHIVQLMAYINGAVDDRSDDIIPDSQLYNLLCGLIAQLQQTPGASPQAIRQLAAKRAAAYLPNQPAACDKLQRTLQVMLLAYLAALARQQAEEELLNAHIITEVIS